MKLAFIILVLLFLSNIPSMYYGWYLDYDWVDTAQHFSGGFFVAMFMAGYLKNHLLEKARLKNLIIVTGATLLVGVLWEFTEYIANQTLIDYFYQKFQARVYFMGDLNDTIADLAMDISGAVLFYSLHLLWSRKTHQVETIS